MNADTCLLFSLKSCKNPHCIAPEAWNDLENKMKNKRKKANTVDREASCIRA